MKQKAIAFYWTFSIPWAGFTHVPYRDADAAAERSRTIKYQRDLIRGYADREGYELIAERAFVDSSPDRGTDKINSRIADISNLCKQNNASLMTVDFTGDIARRKHNHLIYSIEKSGVICVQVAHHNDIVSLDEFDPAKHFKKKREENRERSNNSRRNERIALSLEIIKDAAANGLTLGKIADFMNSNGFFTPTGRSWSDDNVRKFIKKYDNI